MNPNEIGLAIKERRKELRLSQAQLAELGSSSKPFIIAAEAGKPTLRLDKLLDILDVLGLTLSVQPKDPHG